MLAFQNSQTHKPDLLLSVRTLLEESYEYLFAWAFISPPLPLVLQNHQIDKSYHVGRVLLLGDAEH